MIKTQKAVLTLLVIVAVTLFVGQSAVQANEAPAKYLQQFLDNKNGFKYSGTAHFSWPSGSASEDMHVNLTVVKGKDIWIFSGIQAGVGPGDFEDMIPALKVLIESEEWYIDISPDATDWGLHSLDSPAENGILPPGHYNCPNPCASIGLTLSIP